MPTRRRVAVVGAGVAGLAAAWELSRDPGLEVLVLDAAPVVGGKLRSAEVGGLTVDVGAESMLARRPEGLDLAHATGLSEGLVHPRPAAASVWSRGALHALPPGTVMGVPTDPEATAGLLDAGEVERALAERVGPPVETDVSVGDFVAGRVGAAVVDRLVEPLLAGVYAGHARRLSLQATVPALWTAAVDGMPLVGHRAPGDAGGGPVFAGYRGGLGRWALDLAARLSETGAEIRTGVTVRAVERSAVGWTLTTGPTTNPERIQVDGVVFAVPAAPASRLLGPAAATAARELAGIEYASVAIVTLALPRASVPIAGSGFLVPPVEPLTIKAATFSSAKWEWVDALSTDLVLVRASLGRAGDTAVLQRDDGELVALVTNDLQQVLGGPIAPVDAHVQRWGGALPQYEVGHVDRVARILVDVAKLPALGVAGAAYEGVGIPACIASGRRAARQVAAQVRSAGLRR